MALKALTVDTTVEYVSDMDPAKKRVMVPVDPNDKSKGEREEVQIEPGATVFKLKPLDVFLMGMIYDNASTLHGRQGDDTVGISTKVNQTNIDAVRHSLVGLENFTDEQGNPVKIAFQDVMVGGREYKVVADRTLNRLGIRLIGELASQVKEISEVKKEVEGN